MDIQKIITDVLSKLEGDDNLIAKFTADPVKTLEGLLNIDLPDDQINAVITAIKGKLQLNDAAESVSGLFNAVKGLFDK